MNRYDYASLRAKALSANATQQDLKNLADWLFNYNPRAWNGEFYNIDDGRELVPVYKQIAEDEYEIDGYEIR